MTESSAKRESWPPVLLAGWEVLPDRHLVRRAGQEVSLEPRLMAVLMHLAARPGEVVTRTDLLAAVWGDTVVQEEALTQAISQLRRTLGDDSRAPTMIETIPKQGYRLMAEVTPLVRPDAPPSSADRRLRAGRRPLGVAAAVALVALAVFVGLRGRGPSGTVAPVLPAERPLTALPGDEAYPALSPDGQLVAFAWRPDAVGTFKLQIMRPGTFRMTALTTGPDEDRSPAWSPDGERIAFVRRSPAGWRVCVVAAIGGPVQELGPVHWVLGDLDWAPDGQVVVYSAKDKQEAPMQLRQLRVADGQVTMLTEPEQLSRGDNHPRLSPDGTRLAFVRGDRGAARDVFVMPAQGGAPAQVTRGFFSCSGLDWTPDGQALILSATWRGPYELWRVSAAGGQPTLLPFKGHRLLHPSVAPVGGALVFVDHALDTELMSGRCESPDAPVPAAPSTRLDASGRFSPDGTRILFISERGGTGELWLFDRADGTVRQLTDDLGDALGKPRWSPDGRRVAVNVARGGLLQVVVVDVAGGLQRQVTAGPGHFRFGHWSADGQWLFYSRENGPDWQVARVRLDGTGAEDVPVAGCLSVSELPDGTLYYFKETADGLFRRGPDGPEELAVAPDDLTDTVNLDFAATGFWSLRSEGERTTLVFQPFAGGAARTGAVLPAHATGEFDVTADGREYLFTAIKQSGSDLVIVPDFSR